MSVDVTTVVDELRTDVRVGHQIVETLYLPPVDERFGEPDAPLPAALRAALEAQGVRRLWSHQARGLDALARGEDVLITTPTASGKSLIFQLPVLADALAGSEGRALLLYPLKALGRDQRSKLSELAAAAGLGNEAFSCAIYDGDTTRSRRARIKKRFPKVVITNPDMLHLGILGSWQQWSPFLRNLRWVVLDELHTYRGIFGCHFHHVLARLLRLAAREGARPTIVASSATAANAGEFAEILARRRFEWISESGSPREGRHFLMVQPETSPYTTTLHLLVSLVERGLKTIVFTKARRITELLYSWLERQAPQIARRVANYRSGFLPEERRRIEQRLFSGELDAVISTSALEMGIDVGGLDACILVGYPGSVMATWQRSGRVGRSGRESLTALVALPDALDQYFVQQPQQLVERPFEQLLIDPANEPVSRAHLECAAAEAPLSKEADHEYLEAHATLVGDMLRSRELVASEDGSELFARRLRPQRDVSLRGGGETFAIFAESARERLIGTVDGVRVLHECHPGAIYLHQGRQYLVRELDLDARRVRCRAVSVDYFTTPMTEKDTRVLEVMEQKEVGPLRAWLGRLGVTERVVGFERKRIMGREVIDRHDLDLPPVSYETVGLWWSASPAIEETIRAAGEHFMGALHAAEHATISLFPLIALCDRNDLGGISMPLHPQVRTGVVFVYDGHPGGVGITARGFEQLESLLARVVDLLERCGCETGCPSCVQSPKCGNGNRPLDKSGAARLLRLLLGREEAISAPEGLEVPEPDWGAEAEESPRVGDRGEDERAGRSGSGRQMGGPIVAPTSDHAASSVDGTSEAPWVPAARRAHWRRRPGLPRVSHHTVLFDLETRRSAGEVGGWNQTHRMLVAVGVVCHLQEGTFETFYEDGVKDLIQRLEAADLVVGFNIRRFDYGVLAGYTGIDYSRKLPTLDLLESVKRRLGRSVGLGALAAATLQEEKTADGIASLEWVRRGELDKVEAYCRHDVEILRDLYLFGRRMGYVLAPDEDGRSVKVRVDW